MKTTVAVFLLLGLFGMNISLYRKHFYVNLRLTCGQGHRITAESTMMTCPPSATKNCNRFLIIQRTPLYFMLDFIEILETRPCGSGLQVFETILVQQESTWEEALQYCRRHYTDLAIQSSDVILAETMTAQTDDVWIGLCFIAGHWFWVNGEDLQYKVWSIGGELQCPALNQCCGVYNVKQRAWKATACERRLNFLCVIR